MSNIKKTYRIVMFAITAFLIFTSSAFAASLQITHQAEMDNTPITTNPVTVYEGQNLKVTYTVSTNVASGVTLSAVNLVNDNNLSRITVAPPQDNTCRAGSVVKPDTSCQYVIDYSPKKTEQGDIKLAVRAGISTVNSDALHLDGVAGSPLVLTPPASSIQTTAVGTNNTFNYTIHNVSSGPVELNGVPTLTADPVLTGSEIQTYENSCGTLLGAAQYCYYQVTYSPVSTNENTQLAFNWQYDTNKAPIKSSGVKLTSTATPAVRVLSINFTEPGSQNMTITNGSTAVITVANLKLNSAVSGMTIGSIPSDCTNLAIGKSCTIALTASENAFVAHAPNLQTAGVELSYQLANGPLQKSYLPDTVVLQNHLWSITNDPTTVNADNEIYLSQDKSSLDFVVHNTGKFAIQAPQIANNTDWATVQWANSCSSIAPGGSCQVNITLAPNLNNDAKSGKIVLRADNVTPTSLQLFYHVPQLETSAVTFNKAGQQNVTVTNTAVADENWKGADVSITHLALSGLHNIKINNPNACQSIKIGAQCTLGLTAAENAYEDNHEAGRLNMTFQYATDTGTKTENISHQNVQVDDVTVNLNNGKNMGVSSDDDQQGTLPIQNTGYLTLNDLAVHSNAAWLTVAPGDCTSSLAGGKSCNISYSIDKSKAKIDDVAEVSLTASNASTSSKKEISISYGTCPVGERLVEYYNDTGNEVLEAALVHFFWENSTGSHDKWTNTTSGPNKIHRCTTIGAHIKAYIAYAGGGTKTGTVPNNNTRFRCYYKSMSGYKCHFQSPE